MGGGTRPIARKKYIAIPVFPLTANEGGTLPSLPPFPSCIILVASGKEKRGPLQKVRLPLPLSAGLHHRGPSPQEDKRGSFCSGQSCRCKGIPPSLEVREGRFLAPRADPRTPLQPTTLGLLTEVVCICGVFDGTEGAASLDLSLPTDRGLSLCRSGETRRRRRNHI